MTLKTKNRIVEVISALFILLFVYTAINKFLAIHTLEFVLKDYPLIGGMSGYIAWGVPLFELIAAILLFFPKTKILGFYFSFFLMFVFTCYLAYMLLFTPKLPCTCGGMLQKLTWTQHFIFNIIFILLSALAIFIKKRITGISKDSTVLSLG